MLRHAREEHQRLSPDLGKRVVEHGDEGARAAAEPLEGLVKGRGLQARERAGSLDSRQTQERLRALQAVEQAGHAAEVGEDGCRDGPRGCPVPSPRCTWRGLGQQVDHDVKGRLCHRFVGQCHELHDWWEDDGGRIGTAHACKALRDEARVVCIQTRRLVVGLRVEASSVSTHPNLREDVQPVRSTCTVAQPVCKSRRHGGRFF